MERKSLVFNFADVEVREREFFIIKLGQAVSVEPLAFRVLLFLLRNPHKLITKDELLDAVWNDISVSENSLTRCIALLRRALGDDTHEPRYIATVPTIGYRFLCDVQVREDGLAQQDMDNPHPIPRRGYRFIGNIPESRHGVPPSEVKTPTPAEEPMHLSNYRIRRVGAAAGLALAVVLSLVLATTHRPPLLSRDLKLQQLTTNSSENPVSNAILSPDGKYLAYGDLKGIVLQELATGQTHTLSKPAVLTSHDAWFPNAWFPEGSRILASALKATADGTIRSSSWALPILGSPVLLRDDAMASAISPDGMLIAFTRNRSTYRLPKAFARRASSRSEIPWTREVWVMGPHGEDARRLVTSKRGELFGSIQWSPDNSRIAYSVIHPEGDSPYAPDLEMIALDGGAPTVILPNFLGLDFCWLPDGRILYTQPEPAPNNLDTNLWALSIDLTTGRPRGRPRRLTNLPGFRLSNISVSSDGRKVAFQKNSYRSDVYIGMLRADGQLETMRRLTSNERSNLPFAWTIDSKSVVFTSDRTGVNAIYRQEIDTELAELVPTGPEKVWLPRTTPDGSWIVYFAHSNIDYPGQSRVIRLMRVPISGGARELVSQFPASTYDLGCPLKAGAECVVEEGSAKGGHARFFAFNPLTGDQRELFRSNDSATDSHLWTLSPDGSHIAELHRNSIEVLSLAGQIEKTIPVTGWPYLEGVDWAANGESLMVHDDGPSGATLLRVMLNGQIRPLSTMTSALGTWAVASPDGRHLAIMRESLNSNAWLLENF